MSDTDSIKTDRSQSDLQQKYDKLAMEFAKVRMQLNVLKKAYTANISKTEQSENCKNDTGLSTNNGADQEDVKNPNQVKVTKPLKPSDIQYLKQEINTMNFHIHRVVESTKSNQFDYNVVMSEIEYCNDIQNSSYLNKFCETLDTEFEGLKCSVSACLFKILYDKLDSRTKITTDDSRLNDYPNHYYLENGYKTDENKFQTVFVCIVVKLFLSVIVNIHDVLEYFLKEINPNALQILKKNLTSLNSELHSNSKILDNILSYSEDLKTLKFDTQYIVLENILLFISKKYVEFVDCIKNVMKPSNTTKNIDTYSKLRQIIISFICLHFPIGELLIFGEYWDSGDINIKLTDIYNTVHIFLRAINVLEFEYIYKNTQSGMHWHMKNPFLHMKYSRQAIKELNSQNNNDTLIHIYNEQLNKEMKKSLSLEQEKMHWENEYNLLYKKYMDNRTNTGECSESSEKFVIENQLGKCEWNSRSIKSQEQELKNYFGKKINDLIFTNKEMSSQNNACMIEITALKTRLEHSIFVRNELEIKLQDALEHIDYLKEEFQLTSTNYDTQLRAMTEHLASLNETVVFERKHIESLNSQLKTKSDKKKKK